jgi:benzodiazapine receptor
MTQFLRVCLGLVFLFGSSQATPNVNPKFVRQFRPQSAEAARRLTEQRSTRQVIILSSTTESAIDLRGGSSCSDSDALLFVKVGINAVMEAAAMLGIIVGTKALSEKVQLLPNISGLSVLQWLGLLVIIFASSFLGSIVDGSLSVATSQVLDPNMVPGDPDWYAKLIKPSWNPPGWLFPIMWLIVCKPTQLIAVSRILKKSAVAGADMDTAAKLPIPILFLYCAHLALGDAWNKVFFGYQCTGRGVAVITVFFGLLLASAYLFSTLDATAGKFMLPTCGWVLVATALNWNIHLNNK